MKNVLFVALVVVLLLTMALPVFAEGKGPSPCKDLTPGEFISWAAQTIGHSGAFNPGNDHSPVENAPPFVPFVFGGGCNPTG